jgi:hypothetical protein
MEKSSPDSIPAISPPPWYQKPERVKGKRYTKGLTLLRRILGQAVGLNRHATFSPKEAIDILLAVDEVAPRKGSNIPNYQHKVVSKLRG